LLLNNVREIEDSEDLIIKSAEHLTQIALSVDRVADLVAQIQTASQGRKSGSERLNEAVSPMSRQAGDLQPLINRFNVDQRVMDCLLREAPFAQSTR
jgi:methyl-accepting chemotaxis protein